MIPLRRSPGLLDSAVVLILRARPLCIERLTAIGQIPDRENFRKIRWFKIVLRQTFLRKTEENILVQYARSIHFRNDR
jgi:hypothetical protein